MTRSRICLATIALGLLCAAGAHAQSSFANVNVGPIVFQGGPAIQNGPVNLNSDVVELSRPTGGCVAAPPGGSGGCNGSGYTLPLSAFASSQDLSTGLAQLRPDVAQLRSDVAQLRSRAAQGIALSAAMTIVPPNAGDRFSLTFSGASYDSEGAGSATATYRAADRILVFGGYARSTSQNLFKGGVSFSFK